jgi:AcrR family transcriptional regulator
VAAGGAELLDHAAVEGLERSGVGGELVLVDVRHQLVGAQTADVPVGNVYYYFKTKDALVEAAVDSLADELRTTLGALEGEPTPEARLKAFVRKLVDEAPKTASHGCPLGSVVSELSKREDVEAPSWPELMRIPIDWAERQFAELGRQDARELTVALIASYQGIALLTSTFRDPALMEGEGRRLERWIDSLSSR